MSGNKGLQLEFNSGKKLLIGTQKPEDVAKVVGFLASEDAAFMTGEAIAVNGGAFMD